MKTKLSILAALFGMQVASAKDYVVVVKGDTSIKTGNTEVSVEPGAQSDTITVLPSRDASTICVTLRDARGNVVQQCILDAQYNERINIISPSLPEGYLLEVRDDKGTLYTKHED